MMDRIKHMARKIMEKTEEYKVCGRCHAINKKYNVKCWRCDFANFTQKNNRVRRELISQLNDNDLEYLDDGKYRYITVGVEGNR